MSVPAPRNAFPCSSASLRFPLEPPYLPLEHPIPQSICLVLGPPSLCTHSSKSLLPCFLGYLLTLETPRGLEQWLTISGS